MKRNYPLIGGMVGLVLALLLVTLGFFKTLLILLLVGAGSVLGFYLETSDWVTQLTKHIKE